MLAWRVLIFPEVLDVRRVVGVIKNPLGWMLVAVAVAGLWSPRRTVIAQEPNLLSNGSLETPYYAQGSPSLTVPQGWDLWIGAGAPTSLPNKDRAWVLDGAVSWNISQPGATFTAVGYQQVSDVAVGETLQASASGWVFTCNDPVGVCTITDPPYRRSDAAAGAVLKVGLDPQGGTDPFSPEVRWSAAVAPYDQWVTMSVSTTAQNTTVTVFLYMTQTTGLALNNVYWDKASLMRSTAPPGTEPTEAGVPFVVPQGVRPDGSIVHVVQAGDTLWSIAYAYASYGATVESIAAENDLKPNARFLQVGQELVILPPGSVDPTSGRLVVGGAAGAPSITAAAQITPGSPTAQEVPTVAVSASSTPAPTLESVPLPGAPPTGLTEEATATPSPTEAPTLTPTPTLLPTSTATPAPTESPQAVAGLGATTGRLCLAVYRDDNLNGARDASETALGGAQLVITGADSAQRLDYDGSADPLCSDLPPGQYQVTAALPSGYGQTTSDLVSVTLASGRRVNVSFGGAQGYTPPATPGAEPGELAATQIEAGAVAPLVQVTAEPGSKHSQSVLDRLYDYSGVIVLGIAAVVAVGGVTLLLAFRRPGA
jgi:LysM repeat protein